MSGIFPMFPSVVRRDGGGGLPLYRDVAMDFGAGRPLWSGGNPGVVCGLEAVKSWAWRAVMTARYRYAAFSWRFGCELEALVGQPYRSDTKLSEAARYVEEALTASPYILEARASGVRFEGSRLHMRVRFQSVYGEDGFDV